MTIDHTTLLFFDASCLIAAAGSSSGGSGFLLSLCTKGYLQAGVSTYVLAEAAHNIQTRMKSAIWHSYQTLLVDVPFLIATVPDPLPALPPVNAKDLHVVVAALAVPTVCLLTLDKGLLAEVSQVQLPFIPLTPGDFIKTMLPTHNAYPIFP